MSYWRGRGYYRVTAQPLLIAAVLLLATTALVDLLFVVFALAGGLALAPIGYAVHRTRSRLSAAQRVSGGRLESMRRYRLAAWLIWTGMTVISAVVSLGMDGVSFAATLATIAIWQGVGSLLAAARIARYERTTGVAVLVPAGGLFGIRRDEHELFALVHEPAVSR